MTEPSADSKSSNFATPSQLPPLAEFLRAHFQSRGHDAYLVGGLVRDCLLGRQPLDIDIAVEGNVAGIGADLAEALGGRYVHMHQDWDIGRVVLPKGAVDDSPIGYIDLSSMDGGLEADLRRRDFTVDSMALPLSATSLRRHEIIDPMNGLRDIDAKVIRANGDSVFRDDPARLLRAARLASSLGFTIDEDTESKIRRDVALVNRIAPERTRDELMRMLSAPAAVDAVRWIDRIGLLSQILPELDDSRDVVQPKEHHWDVFNHLMEAVGHVDKIFASILGLQKNCEEAIYSVVPTFEGVEEFFDEEIGDGHTRLTFLRLTALLHDVAKPATKTIEPSGKMRFLGHHTLGEEMAGEILGRLRFSRRGTRLVTQMIRNHLRPTQMSAKGEMPSGRALYRYYRDVPDAAVDTLYLNMADFLAARGPTITEADWRDHCELIDYILTKGRQQNAPETLPKIITGNDIMNALSLQPGPEVGRLLGLAREAQANGEVNSMDEALNLVKKLADSKLEPGGCGA